MVEVCPQCGANLPPDAPGGVCPKCVLALAAGSAAAGSEQAAETTPFRPGSKFVPPEPTELAKLFPQLEILELVGQGGMGAVYKARQPRLNRLVALKILPPEVALGPGFAERFQREAQALAQLSHPHVVAVYDFGETAEPKASAPGTPLFYFLMEYVDGVNLRQLLRDRKLEPRKALAIVPQICEALQYAHDEGIVHRDIKPENILLDKKGRVKIADFGLAKLLGRESGPQTLTGSHQVMGTPHYMAPEQMERPLAVDHRADIYSLGVVFYEMLTGELPLGRFQPPSQKVQVDVRLDEVVLRSLEKEPARRYQHASDVKTDVETIGRSSQTAPETFPAQTMPRDVTDHLLGLAVTPIILGVFLGLPFLAICLLCSGLGLNAPRSAGIGAVAGLAVLLTAFVILGSGSVQSVVVDRSGLTIRRHIGPSRFLPWSTVVRIEPISRRDVVWQVWLWPGLPPRGSIMCMSALHYYRIDCHGDCWYFAPRDPGTFLAAAARWLEAGKVPAAPPAANAGRTRRWPLVLGFCCLFALGVALGFLFLTRGYDPDPPPSLWVMAPDGPTITAEFAASLQLDADRADVVTKALRKFYRDFRAAEEANTTRPINKPGAKDDARQITIIAPMGDAVKKLKGEFWAEMARVLSRRQLEFEAKGWLHTLELDVFRAFPGFQAVTSRHPAWPYQPGYMDQFPYRDFRIEIWRVGQLYHWKVRIHQPGVPAPPGVPIGPRQKRVAEDLESSGRQLPAEYRRFWKEPPAPGKA